VTQSDRRREAAIAGHTGDETLARRHTEDPSARVRATAYEALARMGRLDPHDLSRAAGDADPEVRRRAAELAGRSSHTVTNAAAVAYALLADSDTTVVEMAAWACGEQTDPPPETVTALAAIAATHDDPLCREAAVAALGALGDPRGLAAVLDAMRDKPAVRRRAVLALAAFEGPEVEAALEAATDDRDWQVRQAAIDLLQT
jgi:HEAT repeat protein